MKICRECGTEIVDGENGCTMAGDVCFKCKPWNMKFVPATNWGYPTEEDIDTLESRCLDMEEWVD